MEDQKEKEKEKALCWSFFVFVLAVLVITTVLFTIWHKFHHSNATHGPDRLGAIADNYANALEIAMQFFDIQKSGKLVNNEIAWRGDSELEDRSEEKLDLSKGLHDAADVVKFGFPMPFTAIVLSWAILDLLCFNEQIAFDLKWVSFSLFLFFSWEKVGDPELDHKFWEIPKTMTEKQPLMQVNTTFPGTEVATQTAAAMASASLVFKRLNSTYSGYGDELLWAAAWLYHATGDQSYLKYVILENGMAFANWGNPTWFSCDDKLAATQVLLSRIDFFGTKRIPLLENLGLKMYTVEPTPAAKGTELGASLPNFTD